MNSSSINKAYLRVVFYDKGRLLQGIAKGDELDAETPADLLLALRREQREGESSLIVLTKSRQHSELQRDTRFHTQVIGQQDDMMALRIALRAQSALISQRGGAA